MHPVPARHWRCYGDAPLPTREEALAAPLAAFPSWWLWMRCSCGRERWLNQVHADPAWQDERLADLVPRFRHKGCDGRPLEVELRTDGDAVGKVVRRVGLVGEGLPIDRKAI